MNTRIPLRTTDTQARDMAEKLEMSTAEIGLSVRTTNCLEERGIFTVNDLLHFTADRDPRLGSFSLRELVDEMQASLAPQFSAQAIATTIDIPDDLPITADRNMLRRVVLNLILNALDAMPDGGTLTIIACETELGVEIEVADSGPGLSKDAEQRLFDPFFSTKCGGTGLGLAIVSRIAEVHGGDVMAQNCPDGGAAVTLCIPQLTASMEAAA